MKTRQLAILALSLVVSWVVMVETHEIGHLLGGYLAGSKLVDFELRPWKLPYSFHDPDPSPLVTLWCGPLFGILAPLMLVVAFPHNVTKLICSFCCLANGLYLGGGLFVHETNLDTARLLQAGSSRVTVAAFAVSTIAIGYFYFRRSVISILRTAQNGDSVTKI